ncbi:MAG TPA: plasmid pRiA4b ORF-3 family protein [Gammaproteobacteria bacterium]|nr:plasmid pRiA4b ORF-3 family protein [Gammaproteobacteria bacterium]
MAAQKRKALKIYELYVELEYVESAVWRTLLVPGTITLPKLHDLLQLAMGWTNSHLHCFYIGETTFGMAGADLDELGMLDERRRTLEAVLGNSIRGFIYEYDFGDGWRHRIQVEPIAQPEPDWFYPLCTAGERAAPPDDVGGPPGYAEFLSTIENPSHEDTTACSRGWAELSTRRGLI